MCHGIKLTTNVFCFQDFLSHVIRRCTHVFDKTLDKIFQLNSNSIWRTLHLRFRQIIGFEVWELQNILNTLGCLGIQALRHPGLLRLDEFRIISRQ